METMDVTSLNNHLVVTTSERIIDNSTTNDEENSTDIISPSTKVEPKPWPLWKEFRKQHFLQIASDNLYSHTKELKRERQQRIMQHIVTMREIQSLLPFFAMITGPTIRPYRMEELSIILGRVTPSSRQAHIHLGRNQRISHTHIKIEYDHGIGCYCVFNLSKNGIKVKKGHYWVEHSQINVPIPLGNPSVIDVQGVLIYIQFFYIIAAPKRQKRSKGAIISSSAYSGLPYDKSKQGRGKIGGQAKGGMQFTYAHMIEEALQHLEGEALQPDIAEYILKYFREEVEGKPNWKNSISGVLSTNDKFIQERIINKEGKKETRCKSRWILRDYKSTSVSSGFDTKDEQNVGEKRPSIVHEETKIIREGESASKQGEIKKEEPLKKKTKKEGEETSIDVVSVFAK